MTHLPHLSGERFTASAYCQARQRLPVELIQRVVDSFLRGLETSAPASPWHGHRVLLVDGSGFSMPDTVETVKKEALLFSLVYNLVRLVMLKAAKGQRVSPHRISFIDALRWLQPAKPDTPLGDLLVNPVRPGRLEPRCLKRRPKEYPLLKKPRSEWRKGLSQQNDAA